MVQEVAPVLTGLPAVTPQLLHLARIISHHEAVRLQRRLRCFLLMIAAMYACKLHSSKAANTPCLCVL